MNDIFCPYLHRFLLVFFEDILVYSPSWPSHLDHLAKVLKLLVDNQLVAKRSKCLFGQQQIDYLGHVITPNGLAVDPSKIQAIHQWPPPNSSKVLHSFLGLAGYYQRFIQHYATLASPLTDILRREAFKWTEKAQATFKTLKAELISMLVLCLISMSLFNSKQMLHGGHWRHFVPIWSSNSFL